MKMRSCLLVVSLVAIVGTLTAQTPAGYKVPRLADGHPDLGGVYDLATLTPIERPAGQNATLTPDEVKKLETANTQRRSAGDAPLAADRAALRSVARAAAVVVVARSAVTTASGWTPVPNTTWLTGNSAPRS